MPRSLAQRRKSLDSTAPLIQNSSLVEVIRLIFFRVRMPVLAP